MKKILFSAFLSFFLSINTQAQIITETEKIGNSELNITMDKRVSDALNRLENSCKGNTTTNNTTTNNNTTSTYNDSNSTTTNRTATTNTKNMSQAEICKQNPRILGYKIQIAVVKSKEQADKVRAEFRRKFPNIKVEIDASMRPNYKILAGSYYTKESAAPDVRRIRREFGSANSIQYRVFCAEAK